MKLNYKQLLTGLFRDFRNTHNQNVQDIQSDMTELLGKTTNAQTGADSAKGVADSALNTANTALNAANSAQVSANNANVVGGNALNKATTVDGKVDNVQKQIDTLVTSGDSSPAADQARVDAKGNVKISLKKRLDDDYNETTAQLAENDKKVDLNIKRANLVDKLEKLIQLRGMYARVSTDNTLRIGIGMNDDLKSVVEYRFIHNADGLLLLKGVLAGVEDGNANKINVTLNGTFNTGTSGQAYTTVIGDKFTFEFTGSNLHFKRRVETRGGMWRFTLSNGQTRNMSCYSATGAYQEDIVFDNLPYGTYKGVAEFLGDDPLNPPTTSPSRGYLYYGVSSTTVQPLRHGKVLPINESTAKYIVSNKSVPDYAMQGRKAGTSTSFEWSPIHGSVTGVSSAISVKLKLDGKVEVGSASTLPSFTYKEIKSFELFQRFDVSNPNAVANGVLWKHYLNHIINDRNPFLVIQNSMQLSQDVEFGLGYFGMLPSSQSVMSKLILNNGVEYNPLPTVAKEDYYDYDVTSAAFVGENASGSYHSCGIDFSSTEDAYNLNANFEPSIKARISFRTDDIAKVYFTSFRTGIVPNGTKLSCQNRICCVSGVQYPNESLGI